MLDPVETGCGLRMIFCDITACFSSSICLLPACSLLVLSRCDRLVGLERKDQELEAVLAWLPSSLRDVMVDGVLGTRLLSLD